MERAKSGSKDLKLEILIRKRTIVQMHRESSTTMSSEESLDENPTQMREKTAERLENHRISGISTETNGNKS